MTTDTASPPPEWLTKREAASMGRMSMATLDRLRRKGEFVVGKEIVPGRIRFRRTDVLAWIEARPDVAKTMSAA